MINSHHQNKEETSESFPENAKSILGESKTVIHLPKVQAILGKSKTIIPDATAFVNQELIIPLSQEIDTDEIDLSQEAIDLEYTSAPGMSIEELETQIIASVQDELSGKLSELFDKYITVSEHSTSDNEKTVLEDINNLFYQ